MDAYFPIIDQLGHALDEFELQLEDSPGKGFVEQLYGLKRDMISLRRFLFPVSELISILMRPDNAYISDDTRVYLRDCLDHSVHAAELLDSHRDVASGLIDLHLSLVSQRMNEVMKVLTFIATIFIPLSFIAGLYGMNFNPAASRWNMPELNAPLGYPIVLGVMTLCAVGMVVLFWRKGWFR